MTDDFLITIDAKGNEIRRPWPRSANADMRLALAKMKRARTPRRSNDWHQAIRRDEPEPPSVRMRREQREKNHGYR